MLPLTIRRSSDFNFKFYIFHWLWFSLLREVPNSCSWWSQTRRAGVQFVKPDQCLDTHACKHGITNTSCIRNVLHCLLCFCQWNWLIKQTWQSLVPPSHILLFSCEATASLKPRWGGEALKDSKQRSRGGGGGRYLWLSALIKTTSVLLVPLYTSEQQPSVNEARAREVRVRTGRAVEGSGWGTPFNCNHSGSTAGIYMPCI